MDLGKVNRLVILAKPGCPACAKTKDITEKLVEDNIIDNDSVTVINVLEGSEENKKKFTDVFSMVPQIFIHGKHYPGGSTNFVNMYESGKLGALLGQSAK